MRDRNRLVLAFEIDTSQEAESSGPTRPVWHKLASSSSFQQQESKRKNWAVTWILSRVKEGRTWLASFAKSETERKEEGRREEKIERQEIKGASVRVSERKTHWISRWDFFFFALVLFCPTSIWIGERHRLKCPLHVLDSSHKRSKHGLWGQHNSHSMSRVLQLPLAIIALVIHPSIGTVLSFLFLSFASLYFTRVWISFPCSSQLK